MDRTIVIFASSIKYQGRCVAGKCISSNNWIRPVSTINGGELSSQQVLVKNNYGKFPVKNLQKIQIQFEKEVPLINQPENFLISDSEWVQSYKIDLSEVSSYLDSPSDLWGDGDSLNYQKIQNGNLVISNSLSLVRVLNLTLYTKIFNGKLRPRVKFTYNNIDYDLANTDANFNLLIGQYQFPQDNAILCISLAEPWNSRCYKVVAAIYIV